jgi:hypothetical protein
MRAGFLFIILLVAPAVYAVDFNVGVSPSKIDIGNVNAGDQKIAKFDIFTVSDEPLLVYLGSESGRFDFFNVGYKEMMDSFSEEQTSSWAEFIKNPVDIDTTTRKAGRSWTEVTVLINVPKDAEPGFHVLYVVPTPATYGKVEAPIGTMIVSIAKIPIMLNVAGDARREGVILDSTAHGYSDGRFKMKTFFKNTGTVTIYATARNQIYDMNRTLMGEYDSSGASVAPGATAVLEAPVNQKFSEGDYNADTIVKFTTGQAEKTGAISLRGNAITAEAPAETQPWWLIILIIAAVIVIIALRWLHAKGA